jgi:hypothetical protein
MPIIEHKYKAIKHSPLIPPPPPPQKLNGQSLIVYLFPNTVLTDSDYSDFYVDYQPEYDNDALFYLDTQSRKFIYRSGEVTVDYIV